MLLLRFPANAPPDPNRWKDTTPENQQQNQFRPSNSERRQFTENHMVRHLHQTTPLGALDGISSHSLIVEYTVRLLGKLNVLRIRTDVVAETQCGLTILLLMGNEHPSAIDVTVHIPIHLAKESEAWCRQIGLIEVEIEMRARFLAEEMSGKRAFVPLRLSRLSPRPSSGKRSKEEDKQE